MTFQSQYSMDIFELLDTQYKNIIQCLHLFCVPRNRQSDYQKGWCLILQHLPLFIEDLKTRTQTQRRSVGAISARVSKDFAKDILSESIMAKKKKCV